MKLLKNALLVASQRNDFLEGELCLSSFVGHLIMGLVENNGSGQTQFNEETGIAFTDNEMVNLITAFKAGREYYDDDKAPVTGAITKIPLPSGGFKIR